MPRLDPQPDDALLDRIRSLERRLAEDTTMRRRTSFTVTALNSGSQPYAADVTKKIVLNEAYETHPQTVSNDTVSLSFTGLYLFHVTITVTTAASVVVGRATLAGTGTIGGIGETFYDLPGAGEYGLTSVAPVRQSVVDLTPHAFLLQSASSGSILEFRAAIFRLGDLPDLLVPETVGF